MMTGVTSRQIGRALWEVSNATGKTYFAAIHPDGSIALVRGDLFCSNKLQGQHQWTNAEHIIDAIAKLGEP